MRKLQIGIVAAALPVYLLGAQAACAGDASALAEESGCLACHAVQIKVVGPAYKDVAAKYRGQDDAQEKLVAKVKAGGSGVWGEVPMPPNTYVSEEDTKTIVQWILSL